MIYFTSDLHFNHRRAFIYGARGFSSIEEMNEALVQRWNSIVTEEDEVYLATKWGQLYTASDLVYLENKYKDFMESFDIKGAARVVP